MKDNIARLLLATLQSEDAKVALQNDDVTLTRRQLMSAVAEQTLILTTAGVSAGDFVVVLCDRGHRFWIEILSAWVVGAKVVCVEANIPDAHARSVKEMTGARFIQHEGAACPEAFSELTTLSSVTVSVDPPKSARRTFIDLTFAKDADMPELAGLIFTSGTTGLPKGVPLTHRALAMNALATATRLRLRADDKLLLATPFRFISSISHFIVTLMSGASLVGIESKLLIKDLLDAMNRHRITAFGGSPFHMQFIAMAGKERLPHLRWAMSSGDHLRKQVIEQLQHGFDALELHVVYGMAELGGRFCSLPPERLTDKAGSVGLPLPGLELTVRDDTGALVPSGETGNIHVTGILEFTGYFANAEANAKVLDELGFRNGDVGYLDADGFLYLSGRSDAVFKRSGLKVSAQIIVDALNQLEDVRDAHVAGVEDAVEGHVPVAYVAWQEAPLEDGEITAQLRECLPVNHIPNRYIALPEIPRTGSGKVDSRRLKALVSEQR